MLNVMSIIILNVEMFKKYITIQDTFRKCRTLIMSRQIFTEKTYATMNDADRYQVYFWM